MHTALSIGLSQAQISEIQRVAAAAQRNEPQAGGSRQRRPSGQRHVSPARLFRKPVPRVQL